MGKTKNLIFYSLNVQSYTGFLNIGQNVQSYPGLLNIGQN